MKIERTPVEVEEEGRALSLVPLGPRQDRLAMIWTADYDFLIRLGISQAWNALNNGDYVYAPTNNMLGNKVLVARVLLDAKPGQAIRYKDGQPLNLRRENLILVKRQSTKRRDRELVMATYA